VVRLLLASDHAEQRGLTRSVRADYADNAAGRKLEGQVVDQEPVTIAFGQAFGLNHHVAEALACRNDDLGVAWTTIVRGADQLVISLDTRLRLRLAGLGA